MNMKVNVAVLALALSGVAFAAEDPEAIYNAADADQDGMLSESEAEGVPGLTEKWSEVDANQDGQVDKAEFSQFEIKPAE